MSAVLDFPVKPEARPYLDAFGRGAVREPDWLTRERRRALSRFAELGFPTRRSESWRYLDLQPLQQKPLLPAEAEPGEHDAAAHELLAGLELPGRGPRLVILDGLVAPELSDLDDLPAGVWFGATHMALAERENLFREMAVEVAGDAAHPFAALNAAFFADGFILDIGPGVAIDQPIEIVHLASGKEPRSYHTRSLIRLNESASKTEYVGIVMLTREPRAFFIPTKSCARARYLVGGNRYSYSRSADQNPALDFAGYDRTPNGSGENGIIDAGKTVRAFVDHFEAEPQKLAPGFFF